TPTAHKDIPVSQRQSLSLSTRSTEALIKYLAFGLGHASTFAHKLISKLAIGKNPDAHAVFAVIDGFALIINQA
ncbi:MAG: hypothetical protein VXX72_04005, partial [Pseudomonadota bacterium]|nr:hypothetical protein [Pseudomonadota bacterium]